MISVTAASNKVTTFDSCYKSKRSDIYSVPYCDSQITQTPCSLPMLSWARQTLTQYDSVQLHNALHKAASVTFILWNSFLLPILLQYTIVYSFYYPVYLWSCTCLILLCICSFVVFLRTVPCWTMVLKKCHFVPKKPTWLDLTKLRVTT